MGNGVTQGGKLSLYLLTFLWTTAQTTGCSHGTGMVNHLIYTYALLLVAPSAKGMQTLLDICYTYGCDHGVQYIIMLVNPWSCTLTLEMQILLGTLGGKKLNFATSYKYLVHVICNDLSDEAHIQSKVRLLHAKSNMLRKKNHFCSTAITT